METDEHDGTKERGVIIVFRNPKSEPKNLVKFCREFYGYKDHSQRGKYTYQRKGLLDAIPHIKINPVRTAIVVREEDAEDVVEFLKKHKAEVYARKMDLRDEDSKKLRG